MHFTTNSLSTDGDDSGVAMKTGFDMLVISIATRDVSGEVVIAVVNVIDAAAGAVVMRLFSMIAVATMTVMIMTGL